MNHTFSWGSQNLRGAAYISPGQRKMYVGQNNRAEGTLAVCGTAKMNVGQSKCVSQIIHLWDIPYLRGAANMSPRHLKRVRGYTNQYGQAQISAGQPNGAWKKGEGKISMQRLSTVPVIYWEGNEMM